MDVVNANHRVPRLAGDPAFCCDSLVGQTVVLCGLPAQVCSIVERLGEGRRQKSIVCPTPATPENMETRGNRLSDMTGDCTLCLLEPGMQPAIQHVHAEIDQEQQKCNPQHVGQDCVHSHVP